MKRILSAAAIALAAFTAPLRAAEPEPPAVDISDGLPPDEAVPPALTENPRPTMATVQVVARTRTS